MVRFDFGFFAGMENKEKKNTAYPQTLPRPTWAPLLVSVGILMMFWSVLTHWVMGLLGLLVFFVGLVLWIKEMLKESKNGE
ncbi:MAG: hypothetical protein MI784_01840 [Cytophagales bacterium]|nr:hypothetical protein [Cytophagales bacterium]